ncbi:Oxoglutarate/iron-dependent dioxygenase - like 10 [Theobroma cacao]|nr:Oxoglutarate/iron-dependent dioxygenase - like 10 [Theobroma cacao]
MATTIKPLLTDLVSTVSSVPPNYVRPESDRPKLNEVTFDHSIPLLDLQGLHGPNHSSVIKEIGEACQNYGFFQVKNHGISPEVIDKMLHVSKEFFHLPESERLKNYSDDPMKTTRLSTSFNVKTENVSSWRDYLRLHCFPLEDYVHEWPTNPPSFRNSTVVSNDRYKSVLHRAVVNCKEERISIPTFYCPSPDAVMRPAPQLIDDDHPPLYRSYSYSEYYQKFWKRGLNAETCLDMFKI